MTPEILAEHDDDDRHLAVMRPRRGPADYQLVFGGLGGLETVIAFDRVVVGRNAVTFHRRPVRGGSVETGSIERNLAAWGDVGLWLQDHAVQSPEATA